MPIDLTVLNVQTNKLILEKNLIDYILHDIYYCLSIRDIINLMCIPYIFLILIVNLVVKYEYVTPVILVLLVCVPVIIQTILAACYLFKII